MLRNILGAIGGYAVVFIIVFGGVMIGWQALGGGAGAFAGEGPGLSTQWIALNLLSGLIAAVVGGLAARKLGGSALAVKILAGIILVLGLVFALVGPDEEPMTIDKPVAELGFMEAGHYAQPPVRYNWLIPFIGAAGALFGGRERE